MWRSSALIAIALLSGGCLVPYRPVDPNEPLPGYEAPKPLDMNVPDGAKIGFVMAMYQGSEWITPPPQVGETIAMANPKLSKFGNAHLLTGIAEFGKLRVLEVKEYSRIRSGRSVVVTFQVAYVPERISLLSSFWTLVDSKHVPILVISAKEPEEVRDCLEANPLAALLNKPFDKVQLRVRVERALHRAARIRVPNGGRAWALQICDDGRR